MKLFYTKKDVDDEINRHMEEYTRHREIYYRFEELERRIREMDDMIARLTGRYNRHLDDFHGENHNEVPVCQH